MATKPSPKTNKRRGVIKSTSASISETMHAIEYGAKTIRVNLQLLAVTSQLDAVQELMDDYGLTLDQATQLLS